MIKLRSKTADKNNDPPVAMSWSLVLAGIGSYLTEAVCHMDLSI